mmetsp:Transcript_66588/g.152584  ORF Transcript_66588/g.152584 Transcript_66588/m.152584 type:complete len:335 (+) Transcript_66588:533-1537(+)
MATAVDDGSARVEPSRRPQQPPPRTPRRDRGVHGVGNTPGGPQRTLRSPGEHLCLQAPHARHPRPLRVPGDTSVDQPDPVDRPPLARAQQDQEAAPHVGAVFAEPGGAAPQLQHAVEHPATVHVDDAPQDPGPLWQRGGGDSEVVRGVPGARGAARRLLLSRTYGRPPRSVLAAGELHIRRKRGDEVPSARGANEGGTAGAQVLPADNRLSAHQHHAPRQLRPGGLRRQDPRVPIGHVAQPLQQRHHQGALGDPAAAVCRVGQHEQQQAGMRAADLQPDGHGDRHVVRQQRRRGHRTWDRAALEPHAPLALIQHHHAHPPIGVQADEAGDPGPE